MCASAGDKQWLKWISDGGAQPRYIVIPHSETSANLVLSCLTPLKLYRRQQEQQRLLAHVWTALCQGTPSYLLGAAC